MNAELLCATEEFCGQVCTSYCTSPCLLILARFLCHQAPTRGKHEAWKAKVCLEASALTLFLVAGTCCNLYSPGGNQPPPLATEWVHRGVCPIYLDTNKHKHGSSLTFLCGCTRVSFPTRCRFVRIFYTL